MYYTTTPEIEKSYYNGEVRVIQSIHIICIYCVIEVNAFAYKCSWKNLIINQKCLHNDFLLFSDPKFNLNISQFYLDLSVDMKTGANISKDMWNIEHPGTFCDKSKSKHKYFITEKSFVEVFIRRKIIN